VLFDFVRDLPSCDLEHRGLLADTGTDATIGRFGWLVGAPPNLRAVEHDGSTWARVVDKKLELSFVLTEPTPIFVAARAMGHLAKNAGVYLDDQPVGTLAFGRGQIRVSQTGTTSLPVDAGLHVLALRFSGRTRADDEGLVDLDWVRLGIPDDSSATYGPPTLKDLVAPTAALSGVPHRSLALRAPGAVRCPLQLTEGARLRASVGAQGPGEGDVEVRLLRDGAKPVTLHQLHVKGGDKAAWTEIDVPLDGRGSALATLELRAVEAPRGTRILLGDPAVVLDPPFPPAGPPARAVVVVVLDGVERGDVPPWTDKGASALPALGELARAAAVFDRHRAPTTIVTSAVASLLTGLPPRAHGLVDASARLPAGQTTIAAIARDAGVRAAMFTGVPTTFTPFGFAPAWEKFVEHAPNTGEAATAPIDDAAAWIAEIARDQRDARLLAVVHARGAHPPWDVTPKELGALQPADYAGLIEPRRAAQVLAKLRRKKGPHELPPADRDRVRALAAIALAGQDRALGALVAALRAANLWDQTLFVVTGDVAAGASDAALFADGLDLKEPLLTLPLYVHFPGGLHAGQRVAAPTELVDVTRTALASLELAVPKDVRGRDLGALASGRAGGAPGPQVATIADRYAVRWGDLLLAGKAGAAPTLCDLALDPTCAFNRRDAMPLATQALFRRFVAADLVERAAPEKREPATLDADTLAKLSVWGQD
jgi:arylsulfatase A-like enzyme